MTRRPLRQFYDHDIELRAPGRPEELVDPWVRHRRRFVSALGALSDDQWRAPTRCDGWNAIDVVWHLITADQFWQVSIATGTMGAASSYLRGFDPATTPGAIAEAARRDSATETLAAMSEVDESFTCTVAAVDDAGWQQMAESPFGHVPAHLALAHAFWDSWLHERDIFVPLGLAPEPELDELWCVTCYSLFAAALQGGLPFDDEAVAAGPERTITESVSFEEFPGRALEVSIGEGVTVIEADREGTPVGSALTLVEAFTGRADPVGFSLPGEFGAQLERARLIL